VTLRLFPRSLAGQLMAVTAVALLLAQAVNFALLIGAQREERLGALAAGAAAHINEGIDRLALGVPITSDERDEDDEMHRPRGDGRGSGHGPGESDGRGDAARRDGGAGRIPHGGPPIDALVEALPGDGPPAAPPHAMQRRLIVDTRPRFKAGMSDWPEMASRVQHLLAEAGVAVGAVRAAHINGTGRRPFFGKHDESFEMVAVAAQLPDHRWITVRARVPIRQKLLGHMLLAQTAILFGLMLGPLLFVAWRVNRPLTTLARAAADTRLGQAEEAVPEAGPEDVRSLTRAFNAMRERIRAMLSEKDRMLGAVGHDLRTPLASLRVRVEQVEDETQREKMIGTINEMAKMLDDILALARAGQSRDLPEPTDLAALVADMAADYRHMGKPVALAAQGGVAIRAVRPAALRRAMRNLIDNALTYGGTARLGLESGADGAAVLVVDDEGPGIPDHRIDDMMEPFARAEESRNRNTGGSGLGLTLARALVQAEGGSLTLLNRAGGGLSARISLPDAAG